MRLVTLTILLATVLGLSTNTIAAPLRADEPSAKEQPRKTVKPRKKTSRKPMFGRKKESDYNKAMRRNELLREPAEESAKQ